MLRVREATKRYGAVTVLDRVDLEVAPGTIHALVGENGAGKSTLCKAIAGATELSSGEIELGGARVQLRTPDDALRAGIAMVYQESGLVPTMTVAQNIELGRERRFIRLRGASNRARAVLQELNFYVDPNALASALNTARRQLVEIARAVHYGAKILIFDEPTAALAPFEKKQFFILMRALRERGASILYITHALEEVLKVADDVTVLRDGRAVARGPASTFTRASLVRAMVGREDTLARRPVGAASGSAGATGAEILRVRNVSMGSLVRNMSLSVRAGEITGIAGLVGSGRTEIAKIVCGLLKRDWLGGGEILLDDEPIRFRVPSQALAKGLVYITEDRKLNGYFETVDAVDNVYLGWLAAKGALRAYSRAEGRAVAERDLKALHLRAASADATVTALSGGNQQKVVIAKAVVQKPRVVFFDEPTRGVDVGSIGEIHTFMRALADAGTAVVMISSYLPEVLALSDRVLVARQGRIVEELSAEEATQDKIMFAALA